MMRWLVDRLIARAQRTPYRKGHIQNADGSLYMERYALLETRWLSARLHQIASADDDRALHDHPWSFVSVVLRGGYREIRPMEVEPCFVDNSEQAYFVFRRCGSIAFRRATDRHAIVGVKPGTWSLFIYGPIRQWWGFYLPTGKMHWTDYVRLNGKTLT